RLDPLSIGQSRDQVRVLFGEPEDTSLAKPELWRYGSLQLSFDLPDRKVDFIGLYFRSEPFVLPKSIGIQGWFPTIGTTQAAVERYLRSKRIEFALDQGLTWPEQLVYTAGCGVQVVFDRDGSQSLLDSIQA